MTTKFGIGQVLAWGVRIWIASFVPFVVLTALVHAPIIIWGIIVALTDDEGLARRVRSFQQVVMFPELLLGILVSAVVTYGVVMELQGRRATIYACIMNGFRRFFPALAATLMVGLCTFGIYFVTAMPFVRGGLIVAAIGGAPAALYVYAMLFVATQASVIDRPGVMGALARSRDLTKGHRIALIALMIVLAAIGVGMSLAISAATVESVGAGPQTIRIYVLLGLVRSVLYGSFGAVMAAVAYSFLRAEKEGTSAAELAAIFD